MRPDDLGNQRIKSSHQRASCLIVILKRSLNQRACVRIIHVIESASTPLIMTGSAALWLQLLARRRACAKRLPLGGVDFKKFFVTALSRARSCLSKARRALLLKTK